MQLAPSASISARALSSVSSYSAAGSLSATMPPPAWNATRRPLMAKVRMAMLVSIEPSKPSQPIAPQ